MLEERLNEEGGGIKELAQVVHRPTCSTCGTIKRYQFNRAAVEREYVEQLPQPFDAGRYHSLAAHRIPDCLEITAAEEHDEIMALTRAD